MAYDKRAATNSRYRVTLATVSETIECRFDLPDDLNGTPYAEYVLDRRWSFGTSRVVYREGEGFSLHAVMKRTVPGSPFDANRAC